MRHSARGVLAIWQDLEPDGEVMVNRWYDREHHAERIDVPGFLSAQRFIAHEGAPKYFIFYETRDPEVLVSAPYRARLDSPTLWTRRSQPNFRNNIRTVCGVVWVAGRGLGGTVATLRLTPLPGGADRLNSWLTAEALPAVLEHTGIVSAALWQAEVAQTVIDSAEHRLRGGDDRLVDWVVVVTGTGVEPVRAAVRGNIGGEALLQHGAAGEPEVGVYDLIFSLQRELPPGEAA